VNVRPATDPSGWINTKVTQPDTKREVLCFSNDDYWISFFDPATKKWGYTYDGSGPDWWADLVSPL
jgi:hypothetical protein